MVGEMLKLFLSAALFVVMAKFLAVEVVYLMIGFCGAIVAFWIVSFGWAYKNRGYHESRSVDPRAIRTASLRSLNSGSAEPSGRKKWFLDINLDTMVVSVLIALTIAIFFRYVATRMTAGVPTGLQNVVEMVIEFVNNPFVNPTMAKALDCTTRPHDFSLGVFDERHGLVAG